MKRLYYSASSLGHPHMGVILEKVLEDKNRGDEVTLAYCHNVLSSCDFNIKGNSGKCAICHNMYKKIQKEYLDGVNVIPMRSKFSGNKKVYSYEYATIQDFRKISYRNVWIGMSILSFYISWTRDMDSPISDDLRVYFDKLLNELTYFVDQVYELLEQVKPDSIAVYNARLFENRLFYDIALSEGIKFECLEVVGGPIWNEDKYYRVQYDGGLPHNIHVHQQQIDNVWNDTSRTLEEKEEIGASFYYKRRTGQPAADIIFTKNMVENLLPEDYDKTKKNIVIFNSSDDEKAALGGEWDEGKLFPTQYDAIEFVVQHAPENAHVYLRIHPNLSKIKYKYHTDLYNLKKYENLTIIEPTSPISSYALMDIADQVVVFGSAMGVEGCFWGKPVLLLWKSLYYELDTCYVPKTQDELIKMLNSDLQPKDKVNALKYGLFYLDRKVRVYQDEYININKHKEKFLGMDVDVTDYLKLLNSSTFYAFANKFVLGYLYKLCKNNMPIPTKVELGTQSAI